MYDVIRRCELFNTLSDEVFEWAYSQIDFKKKVYSKGEIIKLNQEEFKAIGFITKGEIHATKYTMRGHSTILRKFQKYDSFGVGSLFTENPLNLSNLEVCKPTTVFYISEEQLLSLLMVSEVFLKNYLSYVNTKIYYLNQKIDIISQSTIEDKLLSYLDTQKTLQHATKVVKLPLSKSALAEFLGISRASLYRSIETLESQNIICWKDSYVEINNLNGHIL